VLALNFSVVLGSLMAVVGIVLRQMAKVSRKVGMGAMFLVHLLVCCVSTRVFNVSCPPCFFLQVDEMIDKVQLEEAKWYDNTADVEMEPVNRLSVAHRGNNAPEGGKPL
jgi:hypothetical protein